METFPIKIRQKKYTSILEDRYNNAFLLESNDEKIFNNICYENMPIIFRKTKIDETYNIHGRYYLNILIMIYGCGWIWLDYVLIESTG